MRNKGLIVLVCCVLTMEVLGAHWQSAINKPGGEVKMMTSVGPLYVGLKKDEHGPLRVRLGYDGAHCSGCCDLISVTLRSSADEV